MRFWKGFSPRRKFLSFFFFNWKWYLIAFLCRILIPGTEQICPETRMHLHACTSPGFSVVLQVLDFDSKLALSKPWQNYRTLSWITQSVCGLYVERISSPEREISLCEVLSEWPRHALPLPCNDCVSVTSEHRRFVGSSANHLFSHFAVTSTDLYKHSPDAVPPIHAVSYHVATDKPPSPARDKF